jgi:hypothetical protein
LPIANWPCSTSFVGLPIGNRQLEIGNVYDAGLKYNTNPAPAAASTNPKYSNGFGEVFGGCSNIEKSTFTKGAPAKTNGITYAGTPPALNAKMMQTAPIAPSAPATVAAIDPFVVNPCKPP